MAFETKDKEIGGIRYQVTQMKASDGRRVLQRFAKAAIPALAAAREGKKLGEALAVVMQTLDDSDYDFVCERFAETTRVQFTKGTVALSEAGVFDNHFAGKYAEMLEWMGFCAEVNFANFFSEWLAKIEKGPPAEKA